MSHKNLYEILGLRPDASQAEIRSAYLKLAKQWHPDRNIGHEAEAERRFKEVAHAYEVLSNPELRAAYDASDVGDGQSTGFESTMDEADAFDLFISVLLDLAFELAENGADQITIYQALIDMGCPSGTAKTLAQKAHRLGGNGTANASRRESTKTNHATAQNDKNDYDLQTGDVEISPPNKSNSRKSELWLIPFVILVAIVFVVITAKKFGISAGSVDTVDAAAVDALAVDAAAVEAVEVPDAAVLEAYTQVRNGTAPTPILQNAFVFDGMSVDDTGMVTYQYILNASFSRSVDVIEFDSWVIGELSKGFCGIDMLRGLSRVNPQSLIQVSLKTWNGRNYASYKTFLISDCP